MDNNSQLVMFSSSDGNVTVDVKLDQDTFWLTQKQISELFNKELSVVTKHINNIFKELELDEESNVQILHIASADRPVTFYSLDVILAVGYRANSARAIQFRRWASGVLKDYIVSGVAINGKRLDELGSIVRLLSRADDELIAGVADVLASYVPGLQLLREYDDGYIATPDGALPGWELTIEEARAIIDRVGDQFPEDKLFGHDPTGKLDGTIGAIYGGFGGQDMYPTVEDKAANLLYLVVKDHALADGNKRSAAALFVTFLDRNGILRDAEGQPRISNNALAALTLMAAMITRMLSGIDRL